MAASEASSDDWEMASLGSTQGVRELLEENKRLEAKVLAMRIWMRDPLARLVQPMIRGFRARKACDFQRAKGSAMKIQAFVRAAVGRADFKVHKGAAIAVQAAARRYLIWVSHAIGKVVRKLKLAKLQLMDATATIRHLKEENAEATSKLETYTRTLITHGIRPPRKLRRQQLKATKEDASKKIRLATEKENDKDPWRKSLKKGDVIDAKDPESFGLMPSSWMLTVLRSTNTSTSKS